jgi:di/tricarboxylate transporter
MASGAILLAGGLLYKLPLDVVTTGYTSSAVWVLVPALFFGFALMKTGLGKRIAYFVLKTFASSSCKPRKISTHLLASMGVIFLAKSRGNSMQQLVSFATETS